MSRWAWAPVLLFGAAIAVLAVVRPAVAAYPVWLGGALNTLFLTATSLLISAVVVQSYLVRPSRAVLFLGCGTLALGLGGFIAGVPAGPANVNWNVTTFDLCALLAGLCHFAGAWSGLRASSAARSTPRPGWLALYPVVCALVVVVVLAVWYGWLPPFFVLGVGATGVDRAVLWATGVAFGGSGALLGLNHRRRPSGFLWWYALGLSLIAVGLAGAALYMVPGSPLHWTARAAQYLGGIYLVAAALSLAGRIIPLEEALRESEEQFQRAIEEAPIPVIMHAEDGQVLQVSRSWTELTGYTLPELPNFETWLTRAYGEGAEVVREHMHALFAGHERTLDMEFPIHTRGGQMRYWSFSASSPGTLRDGRRFVVGMAVDVTERKQAEEAALAAEQARADLAERITDEINHRVKNNLAMISGLLHMQLLGESEPTALEALRAAIGRVGIFIAIHEQVYHGRKEEADLLVALKQLGAAIAQIYTDKGDTDILVHGEALQCHARAATNLCAVANELIINALKHGSPGADGRRAITVSLRRTTEGVTFSVWNSGPPAPDDLAPDQPQTLGLRLVHAIVVEQYQGRFRLCASEGGTLAEAVIPEAGIQADSAAR